MSRSSSGVAQFSNLGEIQIYCAVPGRPFPTIPGESRNGLRVATTAYEMAADGTRTLVPSEPNQSGGGSSGFSPAAEWTDFVVHILLEPAERDAEASRMLAKLEKVAPGKIPEEAQQGAVERMGEVVNLGQHRVGHFQVECRVLDGKRVMGVGVVELEVLFKGRISDSWLPEISPD